MAWTVANAYAASNAKLIDALKKRGQKTSSLTLSGTAHPILKGIYGAGTFRDAQGTRIPHNTNVPIGEVAEFHRDYTTPTFSAAEGSNEEAGESYLLVNAAAHTINILEVSQSIAAAALPATVGIILKYRQTDTSGNAAMQSVTVSANLTTSDTDATIMQKFLDALVAATDSYGDTLVASLPDNALQGASSTGASAEDAKFVAWTESASGLSGTESLFVASLSHDQDAAQIIFSPAGSTLLFSPNAGRLEITTHTYEPSGSLRTNKIRDVRYNESSCALSTHERDDLDVQSVVLRSSQGAQQKYNQTTIPLHQEIISPGVMRYAVAKITADDLRDAGNPNVIAGLSLQNMITMRLPWPDATYYDEGPIIIKDAFIEVKTPFLSDDAQSNTPATFEPLVMDLNIASPGLGHSTTAWTPPYPALGRKLSSRSFGSNLLRGQRVDTELASDPFPQLGGQTLGTQLAYPGVDAVRGIGVLYGQNYTASEEAWIMFGEDAASYGVDSGQSVWTAATMVPSCGPFRQDMIIEGWEVEYQHASANLGAISTSDAVTFEIYVLPPGKANIAANYVAISTAINSAHPMYSWASSGGIGFTTAATTPGTILKNDNLGFRLPAGYRMAVKMKFPATLQLVSTGSIFTVTFNTCRSTGKGAALQSSGQTIIANPYTQTVSGGTIVWPLIVILARQGAIEMDLHPTAPAPHILNTGATLQSSLTTGGEAYVHIHFWQYKRRSTELAFDSSQSGWS